MWEVRVGSLKSKAILKQRRMSAVGSCAHGIWQLYAVNSVVSFNVCLIVILLDSFKCVPRFIKLLFIEVDLGM